MLFLYWFNFNPKKSISLIYEYVNIFIRILEIFYSILENGGYMDNTIGQRIKDRRKELRITQAQIKDLTGISSGNLSEIENGKILPSSSALINLSRVLECSTDYILFGKSLNYENHVCSNIRDAKDEELLHYYHSISLDDQEELLMIARLKYNKIQNTNSITGKSSHSANDNLTNDIA